MITAQPESFIEVLPELKGLLPLHWEALALNKDKVPLDPNYEVYFRKELAGELAFITLRKLGQLIGYWIAFIGPGLHYQTCLTSTMDIFFIHPEHRQGMAAVVLMRGVLREMERRGVQRVFAGEKLHAPVGRLFTAFGFTPVETYYSKWIGG